MLLLLLPIRVQSLAPGVVGLLDRNEACIESGLIARWLRRPIARILCEVLVVGWSWEI